MRLGSLTVGETMRLAAYRFPEKTAVVCEGQKLSYRELNARCNRLCHALLASGVRKGDKVALLARNCLEYPEIYFGVAKSGAVLVPLNFMYVGRELLHVVNDCDASVLILQEEFRALVEPLRDQLPEVKEYLLLGAAATGQMRSYRALIESQPSHEPSVAIDLDDEQNILYTSGTTGKPKGAVITHQNRLCMCVTTAIEYAVEEEDVLLNSLPMFHQGGLILAMHAPMMVGTTTIIHPRFDLERVFESIQEDKVTYLLSAPTILHRMMEYPDSGRYDLSSLKKIMHGGSPIPTELLRKALVHFHGVSFHQGYGLTECSQLTVLRPGDYARKLGCTGRPAVLVDLKVVDMQGADVRPGEIGEVVTRGPHVFKGYYKNPEATARAFKDGWFHTGDLAMLDEDRYITIVDRKSDMIISGAENIYPREIEEVLHTHPAIDEAAVFGIPDLEWGESVCAAVVLRPGLRASQEEIVEYCKKNLASYKKPKVVKFVDALPKTPAGKVAKHELREPFWKDAGRRI